MKKVKIELVIYQVEVTWPYNSIFKTRLAVSEYISPEKFCVRDNSAG